MRTLTLHEAQNVAAEAYEKDAGKVAHSIGLRAAQIKYVLTRLQSYARDRGLDHWNDLLQRILPPMHEEALLAYAKTAHAQWNDEFVTLPTVRVELQRHPEAQQWVEELDTVLLDIRRTVVQSLSKHAAAKPFSLLTKLIRERETYAEKQRALADMETHAGRMEQALARLGAEEQTLQQHPGMETIQKLIQTRNDLIQRKRVLSEEWLRAWKDVEPVFDTLVRKSKTFEGMENAQLRALQLYLANPSSARIKDPHGAGLLMLLHLGVRALEDPDSTLSEGEKEHARQTLLHLLEDPHFLGFSHTLTEMNTAIENNLRAYYDHPLYTPLAEIETQTREHVRTLEELENKRRELANELQEHQHALRTLEKEADEACRQNLDITIVQ